MNEEDLPRSYKELGTEFHGEGNEELKEKNEKRKNVGWLFSLFFFFE